MVLSFKGVPRGFQGGFKGVQVGKRGTLMDSSCMGLCIFLKSISVPQYQNYISLKCFGLPKGFKEGSREVLRWFRWDLGGH